MWNEHGVVGLFLFNMCEGLRAGKLESREGKNRVSLRQAIRKGTEVH